MIRRPPRSTQSRSSAASDVYKRQLMGRPVGAFLFGRWADKAGRRIPLVTDVIFYSVIGFSCAFVPNYTVLLVLRTLYGIGMGGEWGLGAALAMEKIPAHKRGFYSGVLQQGLSLIHISEPTRLGMSSYAVFCLKKKKK